MASLPRPLSRTPRPTTVGAGRRTETWPAHGHPLAAIPIAIAQIKTLTAQTATGLKKGCSSTMINSQADFLPAHHRDAPVRCPVCEKRVQRQARQQTYCSRKCRQRAHYYKSVAEGRFDPLLGKDTGLPTNPPQKSGNFSALQTTKTGSSLRIYGPARVIERELFAGRDWRVVTSADGVVCHVASRSRDLRNGL